MLDAVDAVIKAHTQALLAVGDRAIPVFAIATADTEDQAFTQSGMGGSTDKVGLPFALLTRLPEISITDEHLTKRVHTYTGYKLFEEDTKRLTYNRCTLHYVTTIFAETRKAAEDLATGLYNQYRLNCQVLATIQLPIPDPADATKWVQVGMDSDIQLDAQITQVTPQELTKAQLYKCHIGFDLANVNIYNFVEDKEYTYNVFVQAKSSSNQEAVIEQVSGVE